MRILELRIRLFLLIPLACLSLGLATSNAYAAAPAQGERPSSASESPPIGKALLHLGGDATLQFGGFVRLDAIHDFDPITDPRQFDPSKIPTNGATGSSTLFQVTATRFNLDLRTPSLVENGRVFFEIDFFTSSGVPRIRHAFVDAGPFRLGQDWSTFTLPEGIPPTLDLENPIAFITQRSPLVRWTQHLGKELELALAAEYLPAKASSGVTTAIPGHVETNVPDGVARLKFHRAAVEVSIHGLVRQLKYVPNSGDPTSMAGGGANLTARVNVVPWLTIYGQAICGAGLSSYRGGFDLSLGDDGAVTNTSVAGATFGVTAEWMSRQRLRSNAVLSVGRNLAPTAGEVLTRSVAYLALNLVGRPHPLLQLGVEYLYGNHRESNDAVGEAHRVQLTSQAFIP